MPFVDPWYMLAFDAFATMLAAIGAIFGVALVAYAIYRIVVAIGAAVRFLLGMIIGDRRVDGVPYYEDEDYP